MTSNLLNSLKPLLYVCKLTGISFYTLEHNESNLKLLDILWFVPIFIYYILGLYQGLINFNHVKYAKRTPELIQISASVCNTIVRITCNIIQRNNIKQLILSINESGERLKLNHGGLTNTFYWLILPFLQIGFVFLTDYFTFIFSDISNNFNILYYNNYALCFFIGIFETFFNYKILYAIHKQFKVINRRLFSHLHPIDIKTIGSVASDSTINTIVVVMKMHYELTQLTNRANQIFGFMTMITIGSNIILVTTKIYFLASSIVTVWEAQEFNSSVINLCSWTTMLLINLITIIKSWKTIAHEATSTATYIHDIWNNYNTEKKTFSNINYLQLASVQLLNTNLKYRAYGVYPLDWTLLTMVTAAVTNYVVILLQFEID